MFWSSKQVIAMHFHCRQTLSAYLKQRDANVGLSLRATNGAVCSLTKSRDKKFAVGCAEDD